MTVGAAGNEVPAAEPQIIESAARLRHVADRRVAARHRSTQHADRPAARRQKAKDCAHQRGLARSVRTEHADELVVADRKSRCRQRTVRGTECQRRRREFDGAHDAFRQRLRDRVRARPSSSPGTSCRLAPSRSPRRLESSTAGRSAPCVAPRHRLPGCCRTATATWCFRRSFSNARHLMHAAQYCSSPPAGSARCAS